MPMCDYNAASVLNWTTSPIDSCSFISVHLQTGVWWHWLFVNIKLFAKGGHPNNANACSSMKQCQKAHLHYAVVESNFNSATLYQPCFRCSELNSDYAPQNIKHNMCKNLETIGSLTITRVGLVQYIATLTLITLIGSILRTVLAIRCTN